jgi:hypothetical protein
MAASPPVKTSASTNTDGELFQSTKDGRKRLARPNRIQRSYSSLLAIQADGSALEKEILPTNEHFFSLSGLWPLTQSHGTHKDRRRIR